MFLSAFGDDSADETKQRVLAVACVAATENVWEDLEDAWLDRTRPIPFHSTDCDSNRGDYTDTPNCENKCLYKDLIGLLGRSGAWGWGAVVDLAGQREFFPGIPEEMSYHFCFTRVVKFFANFAHDHDSERIKISLDNRLDVKFNAFKLYEMLRNDETLAHVERLSDEFSFLGSKKNPRIQVGDLYARECMKHLDNMVGPKIRPERKSLTALLETKRFGADFYTKEYFEDKRKRFSDLEKRAGFNHKTYLAWLERTRRIDNVSNRLEFLASLDA